MDYHTMKFGLLTTSYSGLWHDGDAIPLEDQIRRAGEMGFDGVAVETKRPVASPLDFDADDRDRIRSVADEEGVEIAALESVSNFASPVMEERENNLAMMKEVLRFADDLDVDLVKIFAAWPGVKDQEEPVGVYADYEKSPHWSQDWPADNREWSRAVEGIREVADWAADRDITLALQNHAPLLSPGYEDAVEMVEDVERDNVELCIDAPLFYDRQSDDYVEEAVAACGDDVALSHYGAWNFDEANGDPVQEPSPQFGAPINYETFLAELAARDWDGWLVSEYCLPAVRDHELLGVDEIDRGTELALSWMKDLVDEVEGREPVAADD